MKKNMEMNLSDLGVFLGGVPSIVSNSFYNYLGEKNRKPRFETVFKDVKAELKHEGYDYNALSSEQQYDIESLARDAFEGMREAGF